MKFYILNKTGDTALQVEKKDVATEFDKLIKEGYYALDQDGKRIDKADKVPDTVEELVFGKEIKDTGRRGD